MVLKQGWNSLQSSHSVKTELTSLYLVTIYKDSGSWNSDMFSTLYVSVLNYY